MATTNKFDLIRAEGWVTRGYLALGTFVCGLTAALIALGKAPAVVDGSPAAALLYGLGCCGFLLVWRRWAQGGGSMPASQAFFLTAVPYLAVGLVVGSPSGDTRVPLVLVAMLLAAVLLRVRKSPLKAN